MTFKHNTYRLAKNLRFRIDDSGKIRAQVSQSNGEFIVSLETLALCALIERGNPNLASGLKSYVQETLQNLPQSGEIQSLIEDMAESGVLAGGQAHREDGFADDWIQWAMIADKVRCIAYEKAIHNSVNATSTVLDVGTGNGFLSFCCLEAHAQKVYAIEETKIADILKETARRAKISRIKDLILLPGHSDDVTLPKGITHVVSELFGNDPFEEGVLPTLRSVAKRLGSGVTFVPHSVEVFATLVSIDQSGSKNRVYQFQDSLRKQSNTTLHDRLSTSFANRMAESIAAEPLSYCESLTQFTSLSDHLKIYAIGLNPPPAKNPKGTELSLKCKKTIKGAQVIMVWFRVHLDKSVTLSSCAGETDACEHWSPVIIPLTKILERDDELILHTDLPDNRLAMKITHKGEIIGHR